MTALTTLPVSPSEEDSTLRPLPWRRMGWVTWRLHRVALIGTAALFVALAVWLLVAGLQLHHAYALAIACHPAGSLTCSGLINTFSAMNGFLANGLILQAVPALVGAFVGAPVLGRELESGTFRFAWTQGFMRWRSTLAKLVTLGVAVAVIAGALSIVTSWYYLPYFPPGAAALPLTKELPIGASSPFAPGLFDLRGVTFALWTLAVFAIAVLAGLLIRRVVPAIAATLVAYAALAFAVGGFLRQHYLAPLVTRSLNVPGTAWILSQQWLTKGGRPVSESVLSQLLQSEAPQLAGKGGVPKSLGSWEYLVQHGYTQLTTYQPVSRFWPFQWIEAGWLLALSVLLIAVSVSVVRRRAS